MTSRSPTTALLLAAVVLATGCGRRKSPAPGEKPLPKGADSSWSPSSEKAVGPSAGPSDRCIACRDTNCGPEKRACEGDTTCARNMGCKEECKGDKGCVSKCMRPAPKFATLGKCLLAQCKAECVSP